MVDKDKHLVGQPVFKQLIGFLPRSKFDKLAIEHGVNVIIRRFQFEYN
ncbi:DUF4372 domain-containing protein [Pedobacter alluvionis]|uniref:DUF4372 domain-containing protein n=1 Tax=Pedobacter alluvionis TaxID=475253 RepID=A0ABY2HMF9_9SPHI|nr:DUF4372 domain-containing protein [Pedobacter alluvionis]